MAGRWAPGEVANLRKWVGDGWWIGVGVEVLDGWGRGASTSAEDGTLVGDLVSSLEARAVPALVPELVLALVDGNLDALDG